MSRKKASLEQSESGTSEEQLKILTQEVSHKKNVKVKKLQQNGKLVYECVVCSLTSPRYFNAIRHHDRFHRNIYARECKYCSEIFVTKGKMYEHLLEQHSICNKYTKMIMANRIKDDSDLPKENLLKKDLPKPTASKETTLNDFRAKRWQQRPLRSIENIFSYENKTNSARIYRIDAVDSSSLIAQMSSIDF